MAAWLKVFFIIIIFPTQQINMDQDRLILEVCRSHTITHHSRYDSSGRGIGPSQRPLPDNTQNTRKRHTCWRWDSNPQSQQAIGRRHSLEGVYTYQKLRSWVRIRLGLWRCVYVLVLCRYVFWERAHPPSKKSHQISTKKIHKSEKLKNSGRTCLQHRTGRRRKRKFEKLKLIIVRLSTRDISHWALSHNFETRLLASLRLSVCLFAMDNSATSKRIFMKFDLSISQNLSRKFEFHQNSTTIMGTLLEDFSHSRQYLAEFYLKWEMLQKKFVEKTKTHILHSKTFFRKSCP
jgi:hypothetical protein